MLFKRCPTTDQLSDFAAGGGAAWIAKHMLTCQPCRDQIAAFQRDEALVGELKLLFAAGPDEADNRARARLMRRCAEIAAEAGLANAGPPPASPPAS